MTVTAEYSRLLSIRRHIDRFKNITGNRHIFFAVEDNLFPNDTILLNGINHIRPKRDSFRKFTEKFEYVIQHDLGTSTHGDPRTGGPAQWYGIDQYFLYTINKRWSAGLRAEWFQDAEGSRVAGIGNWIGSNRGWLGLPGFAGNFYEVTAGLNWHINPNAILRPEIRYDWYDGSRNIAGQFPFNNGNNTYQFLYATDLIITF